MLQLIIVKVAQEIIAAHALLALEFLDQSDEAFDDGDVLAASEYLYNAAWQALVAAARQRGWSCESRRDLYMVKAQLAEEYNDINLSAGFNAAELFRDNYVHNEVVMEDYQIAIDRPVVHRYVRRMLDIIQEYAGIRAQRTRQ